MADCSVSASIDPGHEGWFEHDNHVEGATPSPAQHLVETRSGHRPAFWDALCLHLRREIDLTDGLFDDLVARSFYYHTVSISFACAISSYTVRGTLH
jgi:hypothetical protein